MKAREYDNVDVIRKNSETEVKVMHLKHELEVQAKEKKRVEEELY